MYDVFIAFVGYTAWYIVGMTDMFAKTNEQGELSFVCLSVNITVPLTGKNWPQT